MYYVVCPCCLSSISLTSIKKNIIFVQSNCSKYIIKLYLSFNSSIIDSCFIMHLIPFFIIIVFISKFYLSSTVHESGCMSMPHLLPCTLKTSAHFSCFPFFIFCLLQCDEQLDVMGVHLNILNA